MKTSIIIILIAALFLGVPSVAKGDQVAGMDLTLTHYDGDDYRITLTLFRDCAGKDAPLTVTFVVSCTADSTMNFTVTEVPIKPGSGNQHMTICGCGDIWVTTCNGGTYFGLKKFIYETIVTLPPCNHWRIGVTESGSNLDGICCVYPAHSIANPTTEHAYVELTLDNLNAPGASLPSFSSTPGLMLAEGFVACGTFGTIDPNGDSLSYRLATPITNGQHDSLQWMPPYSASFPLPSHSAVAVDHLTGRLCAYSSMPFSSTLQIAIEKWRRINNQNMLIGTMIRDFYLHAVSFLNQPPVLSGIDTTLVKGYDPNDTLYSIKVEVGDTLRFAIWGYDPDEPGTAPGYPHEFYIIWYNGIPEATFESFYNNTDSAYAIFTWAPDSADAGKAHSFIARIRDRACWYPFVQSYTYTILVKDLPVSIERIDPQRDEWSASPVPFSDRLLVTPPQSFSEGRLVLFDMQGRKALESQISFSSTHHPIAVRTASLKPGIYLLQLENSNGLVWRKKVLKTHSQ